jgi:hypothetical protein
MSNIQSDYERPKRESLDLPDLTIAERNLLLLARILFNDFRKHSISKQGRFKALFVFVFIKGIEGNQGSPVPFIPTCLSIMDGFFRS